MTETTYLETDNPRVLAFRYRTDAATNLALAAELEARAAALREAAAITEDDETLRERSEAVAARLRCTTSGYDAWKFARLVRFIVATGHCTWHASWVLFGSADGRGCDCVPCRKARGRD